MLVQIDGICRFLRYPASRCECLWHAYRTCYGIPSHTATLYVSVPHTLPIGFERGVIAESPHA
jgi:hypothetical protein